MSKPDRRFQVNSTVRIAFVVKADNEAEAMIRARNQLIDAFKTRIGSFGMTFEVEDVKLATAR
jgi:hypothetical protein